MYCLWPSNDPCFLFLDSRHECYNGTGIGYLGIHNRSVFGKPCVSWHIPQPERKWFHNFCRNPKGKFNGSAPWCYVNNEGRKEYCKIPKCAAVFNGKDVNQYRLSSVPFHKKYIQLDRGFPVCI